MYGKALLIALVVVVCLHPECEGAGFRRRGASRKQNIVFIMADDLGWNDVGFHNPKVNTPNIDWLARRGIELTSNYAQPLCTPSRSSLMTGKYPSNNGLQQAVISLESRNCLPLEHNTLPELMKEQGYVTKYVGKWHLGMCDKSCLPTNRGFDEFKGMLHGHSDYFTWKEGGVMYRYVNDQPSTANQGTHLTIQDKRDAQQMISEHKASTSPLFMVISPTAPHTPLNVTREMYDAHSFLPESDPASNSRRKFLGLVSALDDLVGETVQSLRDAGLFEDTIIVFTSDNGGASISLPFEGLEGHGNNYPLRNGKTSFHEGGVRVPTIYFNPRLHRSNRGTKRDFLMHITDWLPTFAEIVGQRNIKDKIDGLSQVRNLGSTYSPTNKYTVRKQMLIGLSSLRSERSNCSDDDAAFRWRDYKLIYGKVTGVVSPESVPSEWVKPAESLDLPTISGDSCMKTDENGNTVARCLFNLKDDPLEKKDLFNDTRYQHIVRYLLSQINEAKSVSVQNTFSSHSESTSVNTRLYKGQQVPRNDVCNPALDFPLEPHMSSCDM